MHKISANEDTNDADENEEAVDKEKSRRWKIKKNCYERRNGRRKIVRIYSDNDDRAPIKSAKLFCSYFLSFGASTTESTDYNFTVDGRIDRKKDAKNDSSSRMPSLRISGWNVHKPRAHHRLQFGFFWSMRDDHCFHRKKSILECFCFVCISFLFAMSAHIFLLSGARWLLNQWNKLDGNEFGRVLSSHFILFNLFLVVNHQFLTWILFVLPVEFDTLAEIWIRAWNWFRNCQVSVRSARQFDGRLCWERKSWRFARIGKCCLILFTWFRCLSLLFVSPVVRFRFAGLWLLRALRDMRRISTMWSRILTSRLFIYEFPYFSQPKNARGL